ncbi:MAG: hypothetical protein BGO14_00880 [Chlamydiales bacterium 38-26]|nr:hypothetical protein [Chlamydiales bacterium]OJV07276.1 MAG: hypothetical protein BGO14_00880 [Chlamydiales bacterium 38-26]
MCPCCGIQYGHDDLAGGDVKKRQLKYDDWKIRWMNEGMPWKSLGTKKPTHWNPLQQLKNLEKIV